MQTKIYLSQPFCTVSWFLGNKPVICWPYYDKWCLSIVTYSPRELTGYRKNTYFQCYEWEGRQLDVHGTLSTKQLYAAAANEERFVRSGRLWNVAWQDFPTISTASSFTCVRQNICPTAHFKPPFSYTIYCLFTWSSPEYSWNTIHLALNNNQAINHCIM